MKIVELLLDDELINDPSVGIDGIALVNRPAHMENWLAFNEVKQSKQPYEVLTDDELNQLAEAITLVGEPTEMDGWEITKVEELPNNSNFVGQIKSDPNKESYEDNLTQRVRYKYVGPKDKKNRPFCSEMLKKDLVYRREDIDSLTDRNVNDQFGNYSIWEWSGSFNCRHRWVKLIYSPIDPNKGKAQNRLINKGKSQRNLEDQLNIPQENTTTTAAAANGYDALAESFSLVDVIDNYPLFDNKVEAETIAEVIGCKGYHTHTVNGVDYYMPCERHPEKEELQEAIYDVPQYARDSACKARKYKEESIGVDCGTRVGWTRSAQLCNGDKVSRDIIARMAAFSRHLKNAEKQDSYDEGCALLMVDAWGGKKGIEWAQKELERIDRESLAIDVSTLDPYVNQTGKTTGEEFITPNPCQSGWVAYGTKKKNGKTVPNCIPKSRNSKPKLSFNYNDDKMEITGAALVPNKLIIRTSPNGEPYYVYFSEDTIKTLAYKFMREKRLDQTNIEHTSLEAEDTYVVESWIIEDQLDDKSNALGLEYPKGTWVITMKTDSPKVWGDIKSGKYAGFSVEGYFSEKAVFSKEDVLVDKIKTLLKQVTDEQ